MSTVHDGLRPEAELLLRALSVGPRAAERLGELDGTALDWSWIGRRADASRVVPTLARALAGAPPPGLPEEVAAACELRRQNAHLRHLRYVGELCALARELGSRGVPVLAYKGPALAELLYDPPGLREYTDLDLLVREADLEPARELLAERGWLPVEELDEAGRRQLAEADCEQVFHRPRTSQVLELHWRLLPSGHPQGMDVESLRARARPLRVAGVDLLVFEPLDLLLALCLHAGQKHRWMRLQMVLDVARFFVAHPFPDLAELRERARGLEIEVELLLGGYLAWSWLDAPVPGPLVDAALASDVVRARAAVVRGRVFRERRDLPGFGEWRAYVERGIELERERGRQPGLRLGRARYLLEMATPEWGDRQSWRLPHGLRFLHWAWRPVRLWARHGGRLWQRLG